MALLCQGNRVRAPLWGQFVPPLVPLPYMGPPFYIAVHINPGEEAKGVASAGPEAY
eukprot:COSAG01_NODE_411_length_17360_cov_11.401852_5_plen_56_part_00